MKSTDVWLVGAGNMARDYCKVLDQLEIDYTVIGRGEEKATLLASKTDQRVHSGGITKFISNAERSPSFAIVATPVDTLSKVCLELCSFGIKKILCEKPGGLNLFELKQLKQVADKNDTEIYIAYNRRFYSSVQRGKQILEGDGGPLSLLFEFTEWGHQIVDLPIPDKVKENWLLANSSHVIDMAFYLSGFPKTLNSKTRGPLHWHPKGSIFTGSGITDREVPFAYHANWDGPGRWWIEITSKNYRLIFRPLESLQIQRKGKIVVESVEIDDKLDKKFKPGLFLQTQAFLNNEAGDKLISLDDQIINVEKVYYPILSGTN